MKTFRRGLLALLALFVFAVPAMPAVAAERPSLVVVISVDQMRADYLDRFRAYFGKDGFNRLLEQGAVFPEARHRHAITFTGPGHASIGTGLDPRHHGIVGNLWYDVSRGQEVYCAGDRDARWVGEGPDAPPRIPIEPGSPVWLGGASLGDRLKEKFPGARVVGVALKDRAAVLMAGRKADAVLWFEERFARFVTSSYYPPHPELLAFDKELPAYFADLEHHCWKLSGRIPEPNLERMAFDPSSLPRPRNAPGEPLGGAAAPPIGPLPEGYGTSFPHTLASPKAIVSSPWGNQLVLGLARFVIEGMGLGSQAERPDLLFIGISATDYYGHWFGPDSKEVADGMVRLDASLQSFFEWLDKKIGKDRTLLFLTSDHGVQSIPEVARAKYALRTGRNDPLLAGRLDLSNGRGETAAVRQSSRDRYALEQFLAGKFGYALEPDRPNVQEGAVLFFEEPTMYVNRPVLARRGLDVERVKAAVRDWVKTRPGVLQAFTNTEILDGLPATAPNALAIERSFRADRSGDVFIVLKPGWMWSYGREVGTTHGQPNDDDTRVPLLAWGPGVRAGSWTPKVSPLSIARTVGALFGFEAGEPDAEILEPVFGRAFGSKKVAANQ